MLQTSTAELREKIGAEISSASTSGAKRLKEEINSTLKDIEADVKKVAANADEQNAEMEYALTIHEALLWKLRGVPSNEFTQYITLLELAIPRKSTSEIDTALRELLRLMEVHLVLVFHSNALNRSNRASAIAICLPSGRSQGGAAEKAKVGSSDLASRGGLFQTRQQGRRIKYQPIGLVGWLG